MPFERILKADLYQMCELCNATLKTVRPCHVDDVDPATLRRRGRNLPVGSECLCVGSASPGFAKVGFTLEDMDSIQQSYQAALLQLERAVLELKRLSRFPGTSPDPVVIDPAAAFLEKKRMSLESARRKAEEETAELFRQTGR